MGLDEEVLAHLRLLLRLAARHLPMPWAFSNEDEADLVIVDTRHLNGQLARTRARVQGRRCAEIVADDSEDLGADSLELKLPLSEAALVAVLIEAGGTRVESLAIQQPSPEFYFGGLSDFETGAPIGDPDISAWDKAGAVGEASDGHAVPGFEDLLHRHELAKPLPDERPRLVTENTRYEKVIGDSSGRRSNRSIDRGFDADNLPAASGADGPAPVYHRTGGDSDGQAPASRSSTDAASPSQASDERSSSSAGDGAFESALDESRPMAGWLELGAITMPARLLLEPPGCAAIELFIDPKDNTYMCAAGPGDFGPHLTLPVAPHSIVSLKSKELAAVRETLRVGSLDELRVAAALATGKGALPSKLDPGGSFRVPDPLHFEPDFAQHNAIVAEMADFRPVHDLAARSGAPMARVFDVLTAYADIGRLESRLRQRLTRTPDAAKPSLLSRWFGK